MMHFFKVFKAQIHKLFIYTRTKNLSLNVAELFFQQNHISGFLRYDMIVRLLAVECYYKKNNYGFDLYYRMQLYRNGKVWADNAIGIFEDLIKSYEDNGYQEDSEIILDADLHLLDGSHRMALALYHQQPYISAKVLPYAHDVFYSIEWFRINGFSDEECRLLEDKFSSLKSSFCTPFVCTIWHPVRKYFDEITQNLSLFGEVKEVKDYYLSKWEYQFYINGIYAVDDIERWKIDKKLDHMLTPNTEIYQMRMVSLEIEDPRFRLKKNHKTLSRRCEQIKKQIRDAYKQKIDGYFYDIIMHIGDNYYQNRHIHNLLTMPSVDLTLILEHLHEFKYVITKFDTPYMPKDFPEHYPLGKDIDIICYNEDEYRKILNSVEKDVSPYESFYYIRRVKFTDQENREYRTLIRLEQEGRVLVFLFDISCRTGNLPSGFVAEMIDKREEKNVFYVPCIEYELIIRLYEIKKTAKKRHHIDFVREHIKDINYTLCGKYLDKWTNEILKEIANGHDLIS